MNEPTDANLPTAHPGSARRPILYALLLAVLLIVFALFAFLAWHAHQFYRHRRASDRMEQAICRLAFHRPDDLTDDQWAYCLLMTWNLHSGYAHPSYVPTEDLERIVGEFEAKIDAGPDLTTLDWLWNEYFKAYPPSRSYRKWWPTLPANKEQFESGAHGGYPLSYWQSEYQRLASEQ